MDDAIYSEHESESNDYEMENSESEDSEMENSESDDSENNSESEENINDTNSFTHGMDTNYVVFMSHRITFSALDDLLSILHNAGINLPRSSRTLKTNNECKI